MGILLRFLRRYVLAPLLAIAAMLVVAALLGPQALEREWPLVLAAGAATYLLATAWFQVRQAREETAAAALRAQEAALLARDAELAALHARLRPHFLFNALQSVAALIGSDPKAGRQMCLDLADFLRARLESDPAKLVTLEDELRITRQYLAIERVRFADRLDWQERIDPKALQLAVPPLILQPLVENALVHGLATLEEGGTLLLSAELHGEELQLSLGNPTEARPRRPGRQGQGLALVRGRLQAHHGQAARMTIDSKPESFRVTLHLPARGLP